MATSGWTQEVENPTCLYYEGVQELVVALLTKIIIFSNRMQSRSGVRDTLRRSPNRPKREAPVRRLHPTKRAGRQEA